MKKTFITACCAVLLVACGSSTDSSDTTEATDTTVASSTNKVKPFEMTLTVGDNTGSYTVVEVEQDMQVVLTFINPESADEIHLHGYDLSTGTMEKGSEGVLSFQATEAGEFEIESHETGELLATLKVNAP